MNFHFLSAQKRNTICWFHLDFFSTTVTIFFYSYDNCKKDSSDIFGLLLNRSLRFRLFVHLIQMVYLDGISIEEFSVKHKKWSYIQCARLSVQTLVRPRRNALNSSELCIVYDPAYTSLQLVINQAKTVNCHVPSSYASFVRETIDRE